MDDDARRLVVIWSTFPDEASARAVARALVDARLAACVVLWPEVASVYRWNGAIEEGREVAILVKTRATRAEAVRAAIEAAHPYEVPAVLVLPVEAAARAYGDWVLAETTQ